MSPAASIIIPTHNRVERLLKLIADLAILAERDGREFEVLVIDSMAGSDTSQVIGMSVPSSITVRHVIASNNLAAKRNAGAEAATSANLIFLDDDMRVPPWSGFLEGHLSALLSAPGGIHTIVSGAVQFPREWVESDALYAYKQARQLPPGQLVVSPQKFVAMNSSMTKDAWIEIGGYDEEFRGYGAEDLAMAVKAVAAGATLSYSPQALAVHSENRLSMREYSQKMYDFGYSGVPVLLSRYPEAGQYLPHRITQVARNEVSISDRVLASRGVLLMSKALGAAVRRVPPRTLGCLSRVYRLIAASSAMAGTRDAACGRDRRSVSSWGAA